jgi:protein gp37
MSAELKIHPVAARFPALSEDELEALAQDIKANKQRQPIILTANGKMIIDGVNRWKACKRAGVKPIFKRLSKSYTETDILNYIVSVNLRRRDLTAGQRAMLALDLAPQFEKAAQERKMEGSKKGNKTRIEQRHNKKSQRGLHTRTDKKKRRKEHRARDDIAEIAKVDPRTVAMAKAIKSYSVSLATSVERGEQSLPEAYKTMRREKAAAPKPDDGAPGKHFTIVITHTGKTANYPLPKSKPHFIETNDQVSWAAWTWTIVSGCLHNCPYCYAREGTEINPNLKKHYPFGFEPTFFEHRLDAPKNSALPDGWKQDPRLGRVFVSSMGDLFGKWVPDEWIDKVFVACRAAPWWEYLFLTKFPQRYVELLEKGVAFPETSWLGTTVDCQDRVKIAETAFAKISGVRVKWLSVEPMLERLKFRDLSVFDFIVIGSQSATYQPDGKGGSVLIPAKQADMGHVIDLINQAREAKRTVYCKPNLNGIPNSQCAGMKLIQEVPNLHPLPARTRQGEMFGEAAE